MVFLQYAKYEFFMHFCVRLTLRDSITIHIVYLPWRMNSNDMPALMQAHPIDLVICHFGKNRITRHCIQ